MPTGKDDQLTQPCYLVVRFVVLVECGTAAARGEKMMVLLACIDLHDCILGCTAWSRDNPKSFATIYLRSTLGSVPFQSPQSLFSLSLASVSHSSPLHSLSIHLSPALPCPAVLTVYHTVGGYF